MTRGKKDNKAIFVLFGISVILIILSLFLVFHSSKPLKVQEFDVSFSVKENGVGVNVNTTILTFGDLGRGVGATREVEIKNEYNFPIEVKILISKNLRGLFDTNATFIVESGNNITIPIRLYPPKDFPLGNYTGKIKFEIYKLK